MDIKIQLGLHLSVRTIKLYEYQVEVIKMESKITASNFRKTYNLKRSGLAGIFSASLELAREGLIYIMQKKNFDKLLIKEKNE